REVEKGGGVGGGKGGWGLQRRQEGPLFLACASPVALSIIKKRNTPPPLPKRKDFRIGILGSGFIVNECHLVSYRKAGFNPVAIASRNRENAAKVAQRHDITKDCESNDQLLDNPTIKVLDIAVPPKAHLALIKAAYAQQTA